MIKVIHGDCLEQMELFKSESIDLILTDPPYNTGMTESSQLAKKNRLSKFFNDYYKKEEYEFLVKSCAKEFYRILKKDKGCYIFMNVWSLGLWIREMEEAGFNCVNVIVWDKEIHGLNYQNYAHRYELIIFAKKGSFFPMHDKSAFKTDIWRIQREISNYEHETVKPEILCRELIKHGSKEGELVFDAFAGSGSILICAKQLNRSAVGIEKEARYVKIIQKRLAQEVLFPA